MPTFIRPRRTLAAVASLFALTAAVPLAAATTGTAKPSGATSPTAARANGATVAPAGKSAAQPAAVAAPRVVRLFFLQRIEPHDALKLLRTEASIRSVAMVQSRRALVVSGSAAEIEKAAALLAARQAVLRSASPLAPLDVAALASGPASERSFAIAASEERDADLLFRTILGVRDIDRHRETQSLVVRGATPLLDAGEKLLAALGMLGAPAPAPAPAAAANPASGAASQ